MTQQRDAAKVKFFPPGIPLLTIFSGVLLNRIWPLDSFIFLDAPLRYFVGGAIVVLSIVLLGLWPVLIFRRGGQSANPWKPTPFVEVGGPYKFTRNPMYLQMVLVCIGLSVVLANWWIMLLTPLAAWALQHLAILPEEAYLEEKFGDSYLSYKKRVRRRI